MTDAAWLRTALGPECSEPGGYPSGSGFVAYVEFRGILVAAAAADEAAARAALRAKVEQHAELLRTAPEVAAVEEVNLVLEPGPGGEPVRRFVRPMSAERAQLELRMGVDGALVFHDEATGNFAVATRNAHGEPQILRIGEPVFGDDQTARPLPTPGRTPPISDEPGLRADKARRIRPLLRCPLCRGELTDIAAGLQCKPCERDYPTIDGKPVLAVDPSHDASPRDKPESANTYGQQVLSLIEQHRDGWVLDCGSGSPSLGFYNVVHLELFGYPEVDVVTDGRALPFADETFDAVLSEAVLEHVEDPDAYTREVARVVKPGGLIRLDVAFMAPYHGFPDHYFNMTKSGLDVTIRRAGLQPVVLDAGEHQHPFITLSLVLNGYVQGTHDAAKRQRLLNTTISDAIDKLGGGNADPFDGLTAEAIDRLAAGFVCLARKPHSS